MPTVYEELLEATKITPAANESYLSLAKRLTKKINDLGDAEWGGLSKGAQDWQNAAVTKLNEGDGKDLPELEGMPEMAPEPAEPEPTPRPAKKKAASKKVAKATKPAKAPKVVAKKAKAETKAKGKRGRPSAFAEDAKIKILVKENPYRAGSLGHQVFAKYKANQTVKDFTALAKSIKSPRKPQDFLRFDVRAKHVHVG